MNNDSKYQDYLTALFALVDSFFKLRPQTQGQGRPKKYSDALILKLMLLMHLCRLDGETLRRSRGLLLAHLLRHVQRHYQQWFPICVSSLAPHPELTESTLKVMQDRKRTSYRHRVAYGIVFDKG
jgi:hypothetical protein